MNSYELSRNWFDWCFENPSKVKPIHSAIFFFAIEHCNRLGWKKEFGFPSQMTMDAIGVRKYQTYGKALKDLVDWGFVEMIEKSKNQYSANIISINADPKNGKARVKALDKALVKHGSKQGKSTGQSNGSIDKQETSKQLNQEPLTDAKLLEPSDFDKFWESYGKQQGRYPCEQLWRKLEQNDIDNILEHVPKFVIASGEYLINPKKYLEDRRWMDEELPDYGKGNNVTVEKEKDQPNEDGYYTRKSDIAL